MDSQFVDEAPQHWLHRGDPVLGHFKQPARELMVLFCVKSQIGLQFHWVAVRSLACDVVLLHQPRSWTLWGYLFIDAYFAACSDAAVESAQKAMMKWPVVAAQLEIFYAVTRQPRLPVPVILQHGLEYFTDSGYHWILEL